VGQLKAGEKEAANQLWRRFYARLVLLARQRLRGLPRRAADEEDVALSAFASFCQAVDAGRYPTLDNRDDLWQVLVMHTARKAIDLRRYAARQKRDTGTSAAVSAPASLDQVIGTEPDPEFAAACAEEFEHLMRLLDEPLLREIALKKLAGHSNPEIAADVGWSLRSIERKLALVRALWSEHFAADIEHGRGGK
jgi:DNA-directed RNA polymerase specialized sigma24 family protein